jgi:HK97 gp10 family phage protein
MRERVKVEGLRELDKALGELPKATARNVLKRVGIKALAPVASDASALAPVDTGNLKRSVAVGTKLTKRQQSIHRRAVRNDKSFAEVFAGVGKSLPQGHLREFGGDNAAPAPFMRPAWDKNRMGVLESIKKDLWAEISNAAARLSRKRARAAAKAAK